MQVFSETVALRGDELYTDKACTSKWIWRIAMSYADFLSGDNNEITVTLSFAYTPGGNEKLFITGEF